MSVKPRISIVAGECPQPRLLKMIECLRTDYELQIFAFNEPTKVAQFTTGIKLRLFEAIKDMPGYMRDLEQELVNSDLIIGVESSKLSTFQALRLAAQKDIPCAVIENEFQPYFYNEYENIKAIQTDVYEKASHFFPSTEMAANTLRLVGIDESKISVIHPSIDTKRFCRDSSRREKFRKYVGIPTDAQTVLFYDEVEPWTQPIEVLNALKLLISTGFEGASKICLLFCGSGSVSQELKYRAVDSGLGQRVMFLHQDAEPFLSDLFNASDITYVPRRLKNEFHEPYPLHLLEMMACGVVPIVPVGTIGAEVIGKAGQIVSDDSYQSVSIRIRELLANPATLAAASSDVIAHVGQSHTTIAVDKGFKKAVDVLIQSGRKQRELGFDYSAAIENLKADIHNGKNEDVAVRIEELLLREIPETSDRSRVLRLKGDSFCNAAKYDEAIDAYTESLSCNDKNSKAYRGLGYVAWHSHSHEEAMTFFRKSLMISESDPKTMLGISLVYRRLSLYEEALFWMEKCVLMEEGSNKALTVLSQTCLDCPTPGLPIEVMERILDSIGENKMVLMTLGQLYMNDGESDLGNEMLQRAFDSSGGTPAASA